MKNFTLEKVVLAVASVIGFSGSIITLIHLIA